MKIGIAQLNPIVGDFEGNRRLIEEAAEKALAGGAKLVVFSELVLTGYPPFDLLSRPGFLRLQQHTLDDLLPLSRRIPMVLGVILPNETRGEKPLFNAAILLANGERTGSQAKTFLPTYDVFDERRYFEPATARQSVRVPNGGPLLGLTVCEDIWSKAVPYPFDPVDDLIAQGAELILNLSASPWHPGKPLFRRELVCDLAKRTRRPVVMVNQVGGNGELLFDGGSLVANAQGRVIANLPLFEPGLAIVDLETRAEGCLPDQVSEPEPIAQLESALVQGIRDYFDKQRLPRRAVLGLSGGVDSAVSAHLAVKALGAEGVLGLLMPGPFSSPHSITDAKRLASNLGIETRTIPIQPMYDAYLEGFRILFGPKNDYGITQQNIQSRIRGALVMAVSNAEGRLALATGNKSELSLGYCTLYGDMVGGLCVIGDVLKEDVYALARHANQLGEKIPPNSIHKPPSAELAANQFDTDELPAYEILDPILRQAIVENRLEEEITPPPGASRELIHAILSRLDRNEFKRRQGPIILRVSQKAFGIGRRIPIVHRYDPKP